MVKWWLSCICCEEDVKEPQKPALGIIPEPESSLHKSVDDVPITLSDIKQLEELLEEIDKEIVRARKPKSERVPLQKTVKANAKNAETVLSKFRQGSISKLANESQQVLCTILGGLGNLHWAAAGLSMLAFVLTRVDQVDTNASDCLILLQTMRDLGKHLVTLYPKLPECNKSLQHAVCLITEGAIMCCIHMKCGFFERFGFAAVDKDNFKELKDQIDRIYRDLTITVGKSMLERTEVLARQISMPLSPLKPEYPTDTVGLDERVDVVLQMLGMQDMENPESGVRAVVLHGMGGIGKSTLGMAIHAKLPFKDRAHAKVEVGECPSKEKICDCQKDILVRLSGQKICIGGCSEGRQKLKDCFQESTVPILLFIDNIFRGEDLDELLPNGLVLLDGSRILLTSRDASVCGVLRDKGISCQPYPVAELGQAQAKKLLCMQVFNGFEPPLHRLEQVNDLLNICGGLPLALEVVGRYLRHHTSNAEWNLAIESLQECRPVSGKKEDQLYQSLFFSYNQLAEDYQKAFLDITCLLEDLPWDWLELIYGAKLGTLKELALVKKIDEGDGCVRLKVHDLLVALGRSIQPRTRIWSDGQDELPPFLQEDDTGDGGNIEGILIRKCSEAILAEKLDAIHKSLRVLILDDAPVLGKCCKSPQGLQLCITTNGMPYEALGKLNKLQVLIMSHESDFEFKNVEFPKHLKVLILTEMEKLVCLPVTFGELKFLHTLEIQWCLNMQDLPDTFWQLQNLRSLVLTCCHRLKELPRHFERLHSLEILDLRSCDQLKELPIGFGQLNALQKLDLCGCKSLRNLPDGFSQLCSLQVLHLGDCESLEALPEDFGELICLENLNLTRCNSLKKLPESFGMLHALKTLSLEHCQNLSSLPVSFGQLNSLTTLRLSNCSCLRELPPSFLHLRRLTSLDVSGCQLANKGLLEELETQQDCRVVCEDINLEDSDFFGSTDMESTDPEEHDFGDNEFMAFGTIGLDEHDFENTSLYN